MNSTTTLAAAVSTHSLPEAPLRDTGPHTCAIRKKAREKQRLREVTLELHSSWAYVILKGSNQTSLNISV